MTSGDGDGGESFAVVLFVESGQWQAEFLPERLIEDLDGLLAALRQQPSESGTVGLVNVGDDFFVAARVTGTGARLLLSDVTAAVAWDLARQVCTRLGVEVPGEEDLDDVWPVGDLGLFDDLAMDAMEVGALLSDLDAYADEQLLALARRLGFAGPYERLLDTSNL